MLGIVLQKLKIAFLHCKTNHNKASLLILDISLIAAVFLPTNPLLAQQPSVPPPSQEPVELGLLAPGAVPSDSFITTSNTISQQQPSIPSLWWAKEQFGDNLLSNWIAYPGEGTNAGRIDLIVNRDNWNLLDYIQRYEFVNHFGTVARDYGYNIRVFNYQQQLLATYTCNFSTTPNLCNLQLDSTNKANVRGTNPAGIMRNEDLNLDGQEDSVEVSK